MTVRVLAVDCATRAKRVGLAAGWWSGPDDKLVIEEVVRGDDVVDMARWLAERCQGRVVLGLDAPLGWPAPLSERLRDHRAGGPFVGEANDIFRRTTDRFVHAAVGKLPLDVGADRIARTAHSALELLQRVREVTGRDFPLPLSPESDGDAAIETYPGGTLHAGPWNARGYKGRNGAEVRARLLEQLDDLITFDCETGPLVDEDDLFDAAIAALGAADFLEGRCFEPQDAALARLEGWIWVRRPDIDSTA